jgi:hypothetical protein
MAWTGGWGNTTLRSPPRQPQLSAQFENMYISESRLVGGESQENDLIGPGSQTICHAMANVLLKNKDKENLEVKVKLDSCGSVSIAHSHLLTEVKETKATHGNWRNHALLN